MRQSKFKAIIDVTAFISFIFVVSTGVLMRYILPPRSGQSLEVLGLNRHEWGDIHFSLTFTFLAILSVHLVLHWRFFLNLLKGQVSEVKNLRLALSLVALLAVLALALAPLLAPVEKTGISSGHQHGKHLQ